MKLSIVHVGFYEKSIDIYELHTNFLVVAGSANDAKTIIKNKAIFKE